MKFFNHVYEKCIKISTNMPGIVLAIPPEIAVVPMHL